MNIVIGGGTGGVGRNLFKALTQAGHNVSIISRSGNAHAKVSSIFGPLLTKDVKNVPIKYHSWTDIKLNGLPYDTDVVVNLSGKTIGNPGLWTEGLKKSIRSSRIEPNKTLVKAIQQAETPPKVFISASAVGVYESRDDKTYTESDVPCRDHKHDYFTQLCRDWETSTQLPDSGTTRVCNLRLGVMLEPKLKPLSLLFPLFLGGLGGVIGSGTQPFPWIHKDDVVSAIMFLIDSEETSGPVNLVAPQVITNRMFTEALLQTTGTKEWFAVPTMTMQMTYGRERAEALLLNSPKPVPKKLSDAGFQFKYPTIQEALDSMAVPGIMRDSALKLIENNKKRL